VRRLASCAFLAIAGLAGAARADTRPKVAFGAAALPALADKQAFVFAEQQGGTIAMTPKAGAPVQLADGELVTFVEDSAMAGGDGEKALATIVARGITGTVPNGNVANASYYARSADGAWAVVWGIDSCGDYCHPYIHVVGASGARKLVADNGTPDFHAAWRADGKEVAIGSGYLTIVSIPDLKVDTVDSVTSPAYAPDGTLYVRGHDGSVKKRTGKTWKVVKKGKKPKAGGDEDDGPDTDPKPVTFDAKGKPVVPKD